jgi:hypothetical protein
MRPWAPVFWLLMRKHEAVRDAIGDQLGEVNIFSASKDRVNFIDPSFPHGDPPGKDGVL